MSESLVGKVAIVTGSSRGIGAAIAARLGAEKATVVVNYHASEPEAKRVVEKIEQSGGKGLAIRADVTQSEEVRRLFSEATDAFGRLDILVNNAGLTHFPPTPIADATDEFYDRVFHANAKGTFLCLREAAKHMQKGGRIVNFSTTGVASMHTGYSIYTAAKSTIEVFTRVFSKELKGRNITVNCVAPGAIATEKWLEGKSESTLKMIAELSPLNRLGTPEDIANVVAFLASEQGEWINGQILRSNGGFI